MSHGRATTPLWRVKRRNATVCCVLEEADDEAFLISVTINGDEIAARRYHTKLAAVGDAGFLLECLATEGWTVVVAPETLLQ
jgi:hypothetical protein